MRNQRIPCLVSLVAALGAGGCAVEAIDEDDPASLLGEEEWWDEGPLPEDESSDDDGTIPDPIAGAPAFQLPFPCGQTWAGQTRTNHSPLNSIDFNRTDDIGDPVLASAAGTVTRVENLGDVSYGRWIEIAHGNGYTTRYAHLSSQAVVRGQRVSRGQRIGRVGSTGGSSGPHLHYEQRLGGAAIRVRFDGVAGTYFGTRNYRSRNGCGGGGTTSVTGQVDTSTGVSLNVRAGASTSTAIVGSVADGTTVSIRCQERGQTISGTFGTSDLWDKIGDGRFVPDAYVRTGSDGRVAPPCP